MCEGNEVTLSALTRVERDTGLQACSLLRLMQHSETQTARRSQLSLSVSYLLPWQRWKRRTNTPALSFWTKCVFNLTFKWPPQLQILCFLPDRK